MCWFSLVRFRAVRFASVLGFQQANICTNRFGSGSVGMQFFYKVLGPGIENHAEKTRSSPQLALLYDGRKVQFFLIIYGQVGTKESEHSLELHV